MKKTILYRLCRITFCIAISLSAGISVKAESEYWHQKTSLFEILPIGQEDIVFLGNSITDGGEFSEIFSDSRIKNRGISADVIGGVEKRLDQVLRGKPKKIFLLIGINDVSHGKSAEAIAEDYRRLVEKIRKGSPETMLYIQSVMPINNDFKRYKNLLGRENIVPVLNEYLQEIAEDSESVYINLWPALADKTGKLDKNFTNDGLHLTGNGYKAWATLLSPYLYDESPNTETTD